MVEQNVKCETDSLFEGSDVVGLTAIRSCSVWTKQRIFIYYHSADSLLSLLENNPSKYFQLMLTSII